jgi:S-formylglutathione hydrolase FrmB
VRLSLVIACLALIVLAGCARNGETQPDHPRLKALSSIIGTWGSATRRGDDPFLIARSVNPAEAPYLFLTCGDAESLLPPNREFAAILEQQHLQHEFHVAAGGHDWNQWNAQLPTLFQAMLRRIN